MKRKNQRHLMTHHRAALRGKLARRLGLELRHNPYRGGKNGFGRGLYEAWEGGWKEEDRDQRLEKEIRKMFRAT